MDVDVTPHAPKLSALYLLVRAGAGNAKEQFLRIVMGAIEHQDGNVSNAAKQLGVGRATLDRWIVEFGLRGKTRKKRTEARKARNRAADGP